MPSHPRYESFFFAQLCAADATRFRFREIARVSSKMRWHKLQEEEEEEEEEIGARTEARKEGKK